MAGKGSAPGERRGGRKKGVANTKTRMIADAAVKSGITPLEVMIEAMRALYYQGNLTAAAGIAKDAAPYMHPRLASTEISGKNGAPIAVSHVVKYVTAPAG
jgi:hypothetical protein